MALIRITASAVIAAPADRLYQILADYHQAHPAILPRPPFGELVVERGGQGAGTIIRYTMTLGGRTRTARAEVTEPVPGRVLAERDLERGIVTTFSLEEVSGGTRVTIATEWTTHGIKGIIERLAAPAMLRKVYRAELANIGRAAGGEGS
jgi:hypothetical protein